MLACNLGIQQPTNINNTITPTPTTISCTAGHEGFDIRGGGGGAASFFPSRSAHCLIIPGKDSSDAIDWSWGRKETKAVDWSVGEGGGEGGEGEEERRESKKETHGHHKRAKERREEIRKRERNSEKARKDRRSLISVAYDLALYKLPFRRLVL